MPPDDFKFEDMKDPQALLSQDALQSSRPSNLNLYPRKRELEAEISAATEDLTKSKALFRYMKVNSQIIYKSYYHVSNTFDLLTNSITIYRTSRIRRVAKNGTNMFGRTKIRKK